MGCRVSAEGRGCQAQASPSPSHCEEGASAGRVIPGTRWTEDRVGGSPGPASLFPPTCLPHRPARPLLASGNNTLSVPGCRYSEPPPEATAVTSGDTGPPCAHSAPMTHPSDPWPWGRGHTVHAAQPFLGAVCGPGAAGSPGCSEVP